MKLSNFSSTFRIRIIIFENFLNHFLIEMSQRQFFSISDDEEECDAEFDLSTMTAMDYLKRVRYERKQIQEIVTVRIEKAEEADNQVGLVKI